MKRCIDDNGHAWRLVLQNKNVDVVPIERCDRCAATRQIKPESSDPTESAELADDLLLLREELQGEIS